MAKFKALRKFRTLKTVFKIDNLAALVGTERLAAAPAVTALKFTISTALPSNTTIVKGTRVTPGGKLYFATDEDVEIPAGELTAEVNTTCLQTGEIGNGYYPGQINQLVDPFPYSYSVENTTLTQGGADVETDDSLRERAHIAPESFSSAGPYGAYMYWAKTASQLIMDVSVVTPSPGVVEIIPLLANGEVPAQALLDAVYAECNDDKRRPLTDMVVVRAPETMEYNINFTYYIRRADSAMGLSVQTKVIEAVQAYILWQKSALGRDLNPSKMIEMIMATGVKRMVVTEPAYTVMEYFKIAVANPEEVMVVYGGLEDD